MTDDDKTRSKGGRGRVPARGRRRRGARAPKGLSPVGRALAIGIPLGVGIVIAAVILSASGSKPPSSPTPSVRDEAGGSKGSRPRGYTPSQLEAVSDEELRLELKACDKAAKEWSALIESAALRGEVLSPEAEETVARLKAYQLNLVTAAMSRKSIVEAAAKAAQADRWRSPQGSPSPPPRSQARPDSPSASAPLDDRQSRADAERLAELLAGVDETERRSLRRRHAEEADQAGTR